MAWVDDRIWCHPKFADLSDPAFRVYVHGLAYSAGNLVRGHLTPGMQQRIGATAKTRAELLEAGLWEQNGNGVYIHDWDDHNEKRDARREKDRERKRRARQSQGASDGQT